MAEQLRDEAARVVEEGAATRGDGGERAVDLLEGVQAIPGGVHAARVAEGALEARGVGGVQVAAARDAGAPLGHEPREQREREQRAAEARVGERIDEPRVADGERGLDEPAQARGERLEQRDSSVRVHELVRTSTGKPRSVSATAWPTLAVSPVASAVGRRRPTACARATRDHQGARPAARG